jgi:hypothetical protein
MEILLRIPIPTSREPRPRVWVSNGSEQGINVWVESAPVWGLGSGSSTLFVFWLSSGNLFPRARLWSPSQTTLGEPVVLHSPTANVIDGHIESMFLIVECFQVITWSLVLPALIFRLENTMKNRVHTMYDTEVVWQSTGRSYDWWIQWST